MLNRPLTVTMKVFYVFCRYLYRYVMCKSMHTRGKNLICKYLLGLTMTKLVSRRSMSVYVDLKVCAVQQYRALMVILQSHRTQNMILRCYPNVAICYTSEIYQILSPVLFQQSLYFSLLIHRIFLIYLYK